MPEDYDSMSVKELRACVERGGLSHNDCFEVVDLRQRAKEASGAQAKSAASSGRRSEGPRERRRGGGKANSTSKASEEEAVLREKVAALASESSNFLSRDASAIIADADELKKTILEASLSEDGRKEMLDSLDETCRSLEYENVCEQKCGRFIQLGLMAMTIVPMLLTGLESVLEYALRPEMLVKDASLYDINTVVTGGCGALGLELGIMLAKSGAGVILACHGETRVPDEVESRLADLGLLRNWNYPEHQQGSADVKYSQTGGASGWIEVWNVQMESFESVREFAARVAATFSAVDILVHSAATKEGCSRTVDGHELATQVNYLSPFLLNNLLLPVLRKSSARVVHLTCDAGLQQADWLPWPLRRVSAEQLPMVDPGAIEEREITASCTPSMEYANAKLAIVVHSHELNRRLSGFEDLGVAHVVNPGFMDSAFGRDTRVTATKSARSSMMSSLPPVWIANKIYSATIGPVVSRSFAALGNFMLRPVKVGAMAVYHVATSPELGNEENGGGLFADAAGPFLDCGKAPSTCGRVPPHKQPAAAGNEELANDLWTRTETAIGADNLQPLPQRTGSKRSK
eukprot:TRINITY_DN7310_c0_g3_i1.p1 TRINITY_DN7310_c0_g3~~TRINITY_DN7310_c0_g3_i1.p1  ORF type:complete len:577 (-),score=110.28 TRINITY_DN7310_c0_g3_i1:291-2021(-)